MGEIAFPQLVKLICGVLYRDDAWWEKAAQRLEKRFGPIDYRSEVFPFHETDYYDAEMGIDIQRIYVSFKGLVLPDVLPDVKIYANEIESDLADEGGNRRVNLDPGLISGANLVLASTKAFYHRVYLRDGIYAEVTMFYQKGHFHNLPWTYPDYSNHRDVLEEIRRMYIRQTRESR